MADILTQLQTCLDQLATQFYATLCYLTTYHDHSPATPPPNVPTAIPQLKKIPKNAPPGTTSTSSAAPAAGESGPKAATGDNTTPAEGQAAAATGSAADPETETRSPPGPPRPDSPNTFHSRQRELARDLIIKEQQIEYLISVLPGIGSSEAEQEERIKQLAEQLRVVEGERQAKRREMRKLGEKMDGLLGAASRGTGISS